MGVKHTTKRNDFPSMKKRIDDVNGQAIEVGVLQGKSKWLAGIHEYGCDIKPGRAEYLTVPLTPEASERKARSFSNTFVYKAKSGNKFIARKKGDSLELLYWLTKSVKIPERSFLRAGFDKHRDDVMKKAHLMMADVISGKMSAEALFKGVGGELSSKIKDYARDLDSPPNSPITIENKGSSNPLHDTGDMIGGITWRKAK